MREDYFNWLYRLVCLSGRPDASFYMMLKALYRKEFYGLIPNDDNRGVDGQALRDEFRHLEHQELGPNWFRAPSTVLEMLIALSRRMVLIFIGTDIEATYDKWFWEMIENLGLDNLTDSIFFNQDGQYVVEEILNNLLERTYEPNGSGGLFPLTNPRIDQRGVEIWYQMQYYCMERLDGHW